MQGTNTSRNLATSSNGTVYVVYNLSGSGDSTIYLVKKGPNDTEFSAPVEVATGSEPEVAVTSGGRILVSYVSDSKGYVAYSDNGSSFTPVDISLQGDDASRRPSLHMATNGNNIFVVARNGAYLYRSTNGGQTYSAIVLENPVVEATEEAPEQFGHAYSDVLYDATMGSVVVVEDDPRVYYWISKDQGSTFTSPISANGSVYYSTATCAGGKVYMAGEGTNVMVIDIASSTAEEKTMNVTNNGTGRSLAYDGTNFVAGGVGSESMTVAFSTAGLSGLSSGTIETMEGVSSANVAIDKHSGAVLFLYEKDGKLILREYKGYTTGYTEEETTTENTAENTVTGRDGGVDAETLKENNANTEVIEGSAAENKGKTVDEVIDILAASDNAAKVELIEEAVSVGNLQVTIKNADESKVKGSVDISAFALSALTGQEMIDAITGNDTIVLELEIEEIAEDKLPESLVSDVKTKAKEALDEGATLYYVEIDLFLEKNNVERQQLTEFGSNELEITMEVPKAILADNRTYQLIRTHEETDGTYSVDVLPDRDSEVSTYTISTSKLCTMVFAYTETVTPKSNNTSTGTTTTGTATTGTAKVTGSAPKTGDDPTVEILLITVMMVSGMGYVVTKRKRMN